MVSDAKRAPRIEIGPKSSEIGTNRTVSRAELGDGCLFSPAELPPRITSIWSF